jgi:hypothetical protein
MAKILLKNKLEKDSVKASLSALLLSVTLVVPANSGEIYPIMVASPIQKYSRATSLNTPLASAAYIIGSKVKSGFIESASMEIKPEVTEADAANTNSEPEAGDSSIISSAVASELSKNVSKASSTAKAVKKIEVKLPVYRGNYRAFFNALAMSESSGIKHVVNDYGYAGKFQMGEEALKQAGFYIPASYGNSWDGKWTKRAKAYKVSSLRDFLHNEAAQHAAVEAYTARNWELICHYDLDRFVGRKHRGVVITPSGLLAGSHLVGIQGLINFIEKGRDTRDGNGVRVSQYMNKFKGYHIPFAKPILVARS